MRIVIQRFSSADVSIDGVVYAFIGVGILILLGIGTDDDIEDSEGKMNLSIHDVKGQFLVISQFTLLASTKKGNRPSYIKAARPEQAIPLYEYFIDTLANTSDTEVKTGIFGADMKVSLLNDGPVTIIIDSKQKE